MSNLSPLNDLSLKTFDELFSRFQNLDIDALLVYMIDSVDASALPHLAEQFHVTGLEGWMQCETEEEKRSLLKQAINLHLFKGTKYALYKALGIISVQAEVVEWFEYGGDPYHFRLQISQASKGLSLKQQEDIFNIVNEYKNFRSRFEKAIAKIPHEGQIHWGGVSTAGIRVVIGEK